MEESRRNALIALRDIKDPEEFAENIADALGKMNGDIELAYMLGRVDESATGYLRSSSVKATLRTIVARTFGVPSKPKSAYDYKSPEELAEDLAANA